MEPSDHDIQVLIKNSAKGDAESCRQLYEHLVDKVYAYVRYRTAVEEQAVDLTQDVFIDLFPALEKFTYQSRGQFYSFVFVITRRKLARHYADKAKRDTVVFDEAITPVSGLDNREGGVDRLDISAALSHLDEDSREIVVLRHWSRHTFGEIASLKDMTESAVRVRHHRALKVLANTLEA